MANIVCQLFVCLLLVFLGKNVTWARKGLISIDRIDDSEQNKASAEGGICKSRVDIYGYGCEEHTVTTQDGYILSIQRIPKGRSDISVASERTPVFLQHGLVMDGITWLLNSPDESLGFILADNGYDVWIGNTRGTIYSRGHTSLDSNDSVL